jgi:hypothetical protein
MGGYIGSKAVALSTTGADINGPAIVDGSLTVGGAFTSLGIDDNATSTAITIDTAGNVGVGVVPNANYLATYSAVQTQSGGVTSNDLGVETILTANSYRHTDASWRHLKTGFASQVMCNPASANGFLFRTSATSGVLDGVITWQDRMAIDASGNVGIGTAVPDSTLHVNGSGNISSRRSNPGSGGVGSSTKIQAANVTTSVGQFNLTAGDLELAAGAVRAESINFSGGTWSAGSVSILAGTTSLSGSFPSATRNEGVIKFGTRAIDASNNATDTELMRVESTGRLIVGGTTSGARGALTIDPNASLGACRVYWNRDTNASASQVMLFQNAGANVGTVTITNTATAYNTTSDPRLKENITPIQGASDIVMALNPVTYTFKADGSWMDGFLTTEVQTLLPSAVTGEPDAMMDEEYEVTPAVLDAEGTVVTEAVTGTRSVPDYQGMDYSRLTPILTAALQEALKKIDALTDRIETLEAV